MSRILSLNAVIICVLFVWMNILDHTTANSAIINGQIRKITIDGIQIELANKLVDMSSPVIKITSKVTYKNIAKKTQSNINFIVSKNDYKNMALFSYTEENEPENIIKLSKFKLFQVDNFNESITNNYMMYEIPLRKPLQPNMPISITYTQILTNKISAYPNESTIENPPMYKLKDTINFIAPYVVVKQTSKFLLNTKDNIISYKPESSMYTAKSIEYHTTNLLPSFDTHGCYIHYTLSSMYTTTTLHRQIYVSEYKEVEYVESHIIRNNANKLIGEFSRLLYTQVRSSLQHVVQTLRFKLPRDSYNYYYRDSVGNISTSTIYNERTNRYMDIVPRFPIMGGWNTEFTIKYKRPTQKVIKTTTNSINDNRYFAINLIGTCKDLVSIDNFILEIILPEHAKILSSKIPSNIDLNVSQYKTFYYMDMYGRPTIRIEGKNIIPSQDTTLEFTYDYNSFLLLWKPYYASFGFFIILLTISLINRSEFFISRTSKSRSKVDDVVEIIIDVDKLMKQQMTITGNIMSTVTSYKSGKITKKEFDKCVKLFDSDMSSFDEKISSKLTFIFELLPDCKPNLTSRVNTIHSVKSKVDENIGLVLKLREGTITEKEYFDRVSKIKNQIKDDSKKMNDSII